MWTKNDIKFMKRCLMLAAKGYGNTSPNPMVGALLVKKNRIIGEGYHHFAGAPHAEIEAFSCATEEPDGATLYVSLEPCCVYGRTPPCTTAIIKNKVKRVVVAMLDTNPIVAGRGIELLNAAGIKTEVGLLENEAKQLNEIFIKYISKNFPFVILKSALTLDGKIASVSGKSKWITSLEARTDVHRIRKGVDAVMVGIDTVLADDPELTVRHVSPGRKLPIAIVLDTNLRIPLTSKLVNRCLNRKEGDRPILIIATTASNYRTKIDALKNLGVEILLIPEKKQIISIENVIKRLSKFEITSVLIEGGPTVAASALKEGIVDKLIYYIAPKLLGGHLAPGPVGGYGMDSPALAIKLSKLSYSQIGNDLKIQAYIN